MPSVSAGEPCERPVIPVKIGGSERFRDLSRVTELPIGVEAGFAPREP